MNVLTKNDLDAFWKRFDHFYDGLIIKWSAVFKNEQILEVIVECQDYPFGEATWCNVRFRLHDCTSLRYLLGRTEYIVISAGVHILFEGNEIGLEFGDFSDTPPSMEELKKSPCHAVGRWLEWEMIPYPILANGEIDRWHLLSNE